MLYYISAAEKNRISAQIYIAGWSSPVARRAHNPKVAGPNPAPATTEMKASEESGAFVF